MTGHQSNLLTFANSWSKILGTVQTYQDFYYIQVSVSIEGKETKEREISAFKGLDDGYKKIVITMDNNPLIQLERGYKMINIIDFLLNDNILKEI